MEAAWGRCLVASFRRLLAAGQPATDPALAAQTAGEGFARLGEVVDDIAKGYWDLLDRLRRRVECIQVCTIYNGDFGAEAPIVSSAVRLFNDAIQRAALDQGIPVVELRDLLNRSEYYANPIEPGVEGGRVLAEEILRRVRG